MKRLAAFSALAASFLLKVNVASRNALRMANYEVEDSTMKVIKIYTTQYCGYCARAKELLRTKGLSFQEIDVTENDEMRTKLVQMTGGRRTVPQVFIGSDAIGGYADLARMDNEGKLEAILKDESA
jgi:glutaredoxin 3